jgi:hypothetical protein
VAGVVDPLTEARPGARQVASGLRLTNDRASFARVVATNLFHDLTDYILFQ